MIKYVYLIFTILLLGLGLHSSGTGSAIWTWLMLGGGLLGVITASLFLVTSFGLLGAAAGGGDGFKFGVVVAILILIGVLLGKFVM